MKAKWQQLNVREQQLVKLMSLFVAVFILYNLVWQPLNKNLDNSRAKLQRQQALLTWVQENTYTYQQAKNINGIKQSGASLSSIVSRTSANQQIVITRMQPQGDDLQVWIDEISFNKLLTWLQLLSGRENLKVKAIDLSKTDQAGVVRVRRLQLGKS